MRFAVGMVLVNASHSALNMFGIDKTLPDRMVTRVKKLRKAGVSYPYVAPQAWRYWWRKTLVEHFDWEPSPMFREEKQVFTAANPVKYPDDDVFGYMKTFNKENGGLSVTRISPLKNTPLVSLFPDRASVVLDEGYASRHEGDAVPYSQEFYSTVLKGAFSLELDSVGKYFMLNKAGFRNLLKVEALEEDLEKRKKKSNRTVSEKFLDEIKDEYEAIVSEAEKMGAEIKEREIVMPAEVRKKRAGDVIRALRYISGGAKQTQYLTDLTPKFVIMAMFEGGINPFIDEIVYEEEGKIKFDSETLIFRIIEFKHLLNPSKLFIGKDKGFMKNWDEKLKEVKDFLVTSGEIEVEVATVGKAIDEFAELVEDYYITN